MNRSADQWALYMLNWLAMMPQFDPDVVQVIMALRRRAAAYTTAELIAEIESHVPTTLSTRARVAEYPAHAFVYEALAAEYLTRCGYSLPAAYLAHKPPAPVSAVPSTPQVADTGLTHSVT